MNFYISPQLSASLSDYSDLLEAEQEVELYWGKEERHILTPQTAITYVKEKSAHWKSKSHPKILYLTITSLSPVQDNSFHQALMKEAVALRANGKRLYFQFSQLEDAKIFQTTSLQQRDMPQEIKTVKWNREARFLNDKSSQVFHFCHIHKLIWSNKIKNFKKKILANFNPDFWQKLQVYLYDVNEMNHNRGKYSLQDRRIFSLPSPSSLSNGTSLPQGKLILGKHPDTRQYTLSCLVAKQIGRGSSCTVQKIHDLLTGESQAIKFSRHEKNHHLHQEYTYLNKIHANGLVTGIQEPFQRIIRLAHPSDTQPPPEGYVLPLYSCNGDDYVKNGKEKTQREIMEVMYQLIKGLEYLHTNQMAHGDLKHENILIKEKGGMTVAHIADLESAWSIADPERIRYSESHTSCYCVAKQLADVSALLARNDYLSAYLLIQKRDLFGLGLFFFELITKISPLPNDYSSFSLDEDFALLEQFSQCVKSQRDAIDYPFCRDGEMAVLMKQLFSYDDPHQWTMTQLKEAFIALAKRHFYGEFEQVVHRLAFV